MIKITFHDTVEDRLLKFAVIVSRYRNQWIFCKHRERSTFECPGGHREKGEDIGDAARRELYEETGALEYTLEPVCVYSVKELDKRRRNSRESFGMLFYSEVKKLGELPPAFEMEEIRLFDGIPEDLTYPEILPVLVAKVMSSVSWRTGE
ncbi:NUDIX domain-containing protein [Lachnospiraceae bacterium 54-53]